MSITKITKTIYSISLGFVNVFLVKADGLTLVDTGISNSAKGILDAVRHIGYSAQDVKHILVTHAHNDHTGSLAEMKEATGAPVYMHPLDAELVQEGVSKRSWVPGPGIINKLMAYLFMPIGDRFLQAEPVEIEHHIQDGDILDFAGGLEVIHAPGHSAGQVAFLSKENGGTLFAADAASNMFGLGYSIIYEDIEVGERSLARLSEFDFEEACFGHGRAILNGAAERFREKWGTVEGR
jgi:glyoxylase-like metal-dependent hydrolase (beta-lactamase superfamily II)